MIAIGQIKTGASSIKRAVAWSVAMELDTLPEPTATVGANWSTNLTSRPTELTDGRVSAGLDGSGDLNRNVTTSRRDSSNLLGRTSGGLFTGELNADLTSTHTSSDTSNVDGTAASTVRSRANDGWNLTQAASGVRLGDQRNMVGAGTTNRISFQSTTTPVTGGRDLLNASYDYWIRVNAHDIYIGGTTYSIAEAYVYELAANTDYYAYYDTASYNFSGYTPSVTTSAATVMGSKDRHYFGKAHTPNSGGSGGGGVGGGGATQPP
jgi:hypothetical protein